VIAIDSPLGIDRSLIAEARNGWWVREPTPAALAASIASALANDAVLSRMGNECRAFASGFDWSRIADRCEEIYADAA
jgi:glycosyltransferase involved in cell wall biosynthesis